jgi:hypothetical protein
MQRIIQDTVRKALADELLFGKLAQGGHVDVDVDVDGKVQLIQCAALPITAQARWALRSRVQLLRQAPKYISLQAPVT